MLMGARSEQAYMSPPGGAVTQDILLETHLICLSTLCPPLSVSLCSLAPADDVMKTLVSNIIFKKIQFDIILQTCLFE